MVYNNYKWISAVLILLAYVSQAVSAPGAPCNMIMPDTSIVMDHSQHMMQEMTVNSDDSSNMNCCAEDGECSMSGCFASAIPNFLHLSDIHLTKEDAECSFDLLISTSSSSLYRPPILS